MSAAGQEHLFVFCNGDDAFAVEAELVREVIGWSSPTALPFSPPWLAGVVPVRGNIVPVIDLALLFGLPGKGTEPRRLIVLEPAEVVFAVWAERILGIETISPSQAEPPLESLPERLRQCASAQLRHGELLAYRLDLGNLLQLARQSLPW